MIFLGKVVFAISIVIVLTIFLYRFLKLLFSPLIWFRNKFFPQPEKNTRFGFISKKTFSDIKMTEIDEMSGEEFEAYTALLLKKMGFKNIKATTLQGDQGIDVIAKKKRVSYGFQCKRWQQNVGNKAIQETFAGQRYYRLDKVVVITNSYFTKSAQALAKETKVELWDRRILRRLVRKYGTSLQKRLNK